MDSSLVALALLNVNGYGKQTVNKIIKNIDVMSIDNTNDLFNAIRNNHNNTKIKRKEELEICVGKAEEVVSKSNDHGIEIISIISEKYPRLLKKIPDPPSVLFYKGEISKIDEAPVAVVGTRNPTANSILVAEKLTRKLCKLGCSIISGLAIGIDTIAHKISLESSAYTVAVVAHGLDIVYPKSNSALCDNILGGGGLLLSEYVTGSRPDKHRFVERDRIQSGLSKAVFVVQTSVKGGTMHTANFCRDHNRRLYVYYNSQGANSLKGNKRLIEEGALIFGDELENIILDNNMDFSYGSQDSNQSAIEDFE